jgi:hypothetical protein
MLTLVTRECRLPSTVRSAAAATEAPPGSAEVAPRALELPSELIDGNEIIILAIKPSMWQPVFDSGAWLIASCVFAVLAVWMGSPIAGLSVAATAQLILLVGAARLGFAVVRWVPSWYVLTNRRVIDVQGVRRPRINACLLVDIGETHMDKTLPEKLTRLGTITLVGREGGDWQTEWRSISSPEMIHDRIRRAIRDARS